MQSRIEIINKKSVVEINIEGVIGMSEAYQFESPDDRIATYDRFRAAIDLIRQVEATDVVVNIRSTGGDVNDAILIYEALTSLKGKKRTRCYGYTASAATIIAQAASEGCREIASSSLYLIHRSMTAAEGNADELATKINLLQKTDERIAAIYANRSARDAEEFATLMATNNGSGRWLSPDEVVAAGLADVVIRDAEVFNCIVKTEEEEKTLINQSMVKIKNIYNAIFRCLNIEPKVDAPETELSDEQVQAINTSLESAQRREAELLEQVQAEQQGHTATRTELETVQNRVATLEAELARKGVAPTPTKSIEDPAVVDNTKPEGNVKSYGNDVKNFK